MHTPPAQPSCLRATPSDRGLTLHWRNIAGPTGTIYNIRRKLPGEAAFSFVGTTGDPSFTDASLPPGAPQAQYIVYAQRGTAASPPSEPLTVLVGQSGRTGEWTITGQFLGEGRAAEVRAA